MKKQQYDQEKINKKFPFVIPNLKHYYKAVA